VLAALILAAAAWMPLADGEGPAEPAPPEPPPPAATSPARLVPPPIEGEEPPPPAPNAVAVLGRFAYRLGSEGNSVGPRAGYAIGGWFERRYARLTRLLELGVVADFSYDHFSMGVQGSQMVMPGVEQSFAADRVLTQTSFAALQSAAVALAGRAVRLWGAGGGGLTIAYFSSPELVLRPGNASAVQPLARAAAGVDVKVSGDAAVTLRVDYAHPFTRPTFTTETGQSYSLFGDLLEVGLGLLYRF
jgi:hypothetical protein